MSEYQLTPPTVSLYAERLMLKVLFEYNGFSSFLGDRGWQRNDVARALGLPSKLEDDENFRSITKALLAERFEQVKSFKMGANQGFDVAYQNIENITKYLELNETEKQILQFSFHLRAEEALKELFDCLPKLDLSRAVLFLAKLFDIDPKKIRNALHKNSKLFSYGLLERNYSPDQVHEFVQWDDNLDFNDFTIQLVTENTLLQRCVLVAESPKLALSQFEHIAEMREMMLTYLQNVVKMQKKGVNILLYGLPGTGKTEFATLLGQTLELPTYTMAYMDKDGDVLDGETRLENCRLAQKLLGDRLALIVFDEIEDIFGSGLFERSVAQKNKAWLNQFLETNPIPMIWISNDVSMMDNAYLRRFDFVFEMPNLPAANKQQLMQELVGDKLSPDYIRHFSQIHELSPAVITRALSVVSTLQPNAEPQQFAEQAMKIFNQTLMAQGMKKIEPLATNKVLYNLDYVSCNSNIHKISEGLKRTKQGRICCYGPPGTGKTAWANWLGEELGMPVLVRQGSDLLGSYVGETERNIAAAFEQAKINNMVLVFNEVDTFWG
ncbi:serine/threonine protein phosphatase [[Haemophilus] felis]|uniref:Serine/threonine protein phosphatase n=1 Tax=[Haemophilus] felis TaxID=123822 RepID=A0A1T0AW25_9PAST|nr:serine/threonine protein phosphatase [[Haemophilus] felis]